MVDQTKIIKDVEGQEELYKILVAKWQSESQPGFVLHGNQTYKVMLNQDVPEFWLYDNRGAYESRSFGK